ncbi:MAG TPA: sugar transferase, partial [Myxococcaceae bacterium]|nr:sugar transferase [Myxococcaceae bacterium]
MLRVFHHWLSARKLAFFLVETSSIGVGAFAGATAGIVAASTERPWSLAHELSGIALVVVALAAALQLGLYALDLYDLRI